MRRHFPNAHPLKQRIHAMGFRLWELRDLTGVNEAKLSRCLNGVNPMPGRLEDDLGKLLDLFERESRPEPSVRGNAFDILERTYPKDGKAKKS